MSTIVNFDGQAMVVATNESPPYTFLANNNITGEWNYTSGVEVQMLNGLSRYFNFTYKLINCNNDWGKLVNGEWTGIIGKVQRKEADFGMGGITVTESRSHAVSFSNIYFFSSVTFITPPPGIKPPLFLVLQPFTPLLWISIIIALLLFLFTHWIIIEKILKKKELTMYWAIIAALLRQGIINKYPLQTSLRLMSVFWLLACLTINSSFGGCLISIMTLPSEEPTIDTLNDLAKAQSEKRIQVVAIDGSAFYTALKDAESGIYAEIGSLLKSIKSKDMGLEIVRNKQKQYAYISNRDHLTYGIILRGPHEYHLPPPTEDATLFTDTMAMAMNNDFQYQFEFNKFISDLKTGGFLDFWRHQELRKLIYKSAGNSHYDPNNKEKTDNSDAYSQLHIKQLQSAFYLLLIGILISFVSFLIEKNVTIKLTQKSNSSLPLSIKWRHTPGLQSNNANNLFVTDDHGMSQRRMNRNILIFDLFMNSYNLMPHDVPDSVIYR